MRSMKNGPLFSCGSRFEGGCGTTMSISPCASRIAVSVSIICAVTSAGPP